MWASPASIKSNAVRLKKFYTFMQAQGLITTADLVELKETIKACQNGWRPSNFDEWQVKGYIPSRRIEPGDKTDEPIRTRGWTHWHHLFTPRQLLIHGVVSEIAEKSKIGNIGKIDILLGIGRAANWDSKLCQWGTGAARESISQTFYNQALNTLLNFPTKGLRRCLKTKILIFK